MGLDRLGDAPCPFPRFMYFLGFFGLVSSGYLMLSISLLESGARDTPSLLLISLCGSLFSVQAIRRGRGHKSDWGPFVAKSHDISDNVLHDLALTVAVLLIVLAAVVSLNK